MKRKIKMLGFEIPFLDIVIVRGEVLRKLQKELRRAKFKANLRSRMIT